MNSNSSQRQRKAKVAFAVLAVGVMVSALLGVLLFLIGRMHPHF
jgi:hypothetical protein